MSNKTYDILKWLGTVVLPALMAFYEVIGKTLNIPHTHEVIVIWGAFIVCYNTIINKKSISYHKNK